MKIPDVFIPEKNLDEQIESLKYSREKKTERLEEIKTLSDCLMYETWFDYKETTKRYINHGLIS